MARNEQLARARRERAHARWTAGRTAYERRTRAVEARVSRATYAELQTFAQKSGTTVAEVLRTFIEWGLENAQR